MPFPRLTLPYEGHRIGDGVDGLSGRGCYSAIDFKNSGMSSAQVLLQCIPTSFESLEYHDKSLTDAASYVAAHNFCAKLKAKGGYSFVKASVSGTIIALWRLRVKLCCKIKQYSLQPVRSSRRRPAPNIILTST